MLAAAAPSRHRSPAGPKGYVSSCPADRRPPLPRIGDRTRRACARNPTPGARPGGAGAGHRRAAVRQLLRAAGERPDRGRDCRGDHHRPMPLPLVHGDRAQQRLRAARPVRRHAPDRRRARCRLSRRGQHQPRGRAGARARPADRGGRRRACLERALRPRVREPVFAARPHYRAGGGRARAAAARLRGAAGGTHRALRPHRLAAFRAGAGPVDDAGSRGERRGPRAAAPGGGARARCGAGARQHRAFASLGYRLRLVRRPRRLGGGGPRRGEPGGCARRLRKLGVDRPRRLQALLPRPRRRGRRHAPRHRARSELGHRPTGRSRWFTSLPASRRRRSRRPAPPVA